MKARNEITNVFRLKIAQGRRKPIVVFEFFHQMSWAIGGIFKGSLFMTAER